MNKNLQKLIEVNKFDLEISRFIPIMEEKRAPVRKKEAEKAKHEKEKQRLESKLVENGDLIAKHNQEFEVISADLQKIKDKLEESKSEKETKNLSIEKDILDERARGFHDLISQYEQENERSKETIAQIDEAIAKINEEILSLEAESSDDIAAIKKQQDEVNEKRMKVAMNMESTVLILYEKIRKWAGNSGVTKIYKGSACGGCFIRLNENDLIVIRNGDEIIHCPHCGRILYDETILEQ